MDLKTTKEIWGWVQVPYEGEKKNKKASRRESDFPNDIFSPRIKVVDYQEERLVGDKGHLSLALAKIKMISLENGDLKRLLEIIHEREYDFMEEIYNFKIQLKVKRNKGEELEVEANSTRNMS